MKWQRDKAWADAFRRPSCTPYRRANKSILGARAPFRRRHGRAGACPNVGTVPPAERPTAFRALGGLRPAPLCDQKWYLAQSNAATAFLAQSSGRNLPSAFRATPWMYFTLP